VDSFPRDNKKIDDNIRIAIKGRNILRPRTILEYKSP
jgi:hypothetical protein